MATSCLPAKSTPRARWRRVLTARRFISLARSAYRLVVADRWIVGTLLARGSFGEVRRAVDSLYGHEVAVKLEHHSNGHPYLKREYDIYCKLGTLPGIPRIHHYGTYGEYNVLVMDLLGPSLEELFIARDKKFSTKTILQLGIQLITRLETIHHKGILFRDIKPDNCVIGRLQPDQSEFVDPSVVCLIDFGLSKEYLDPITGFHVANLPCRSLAGTVRYMSINAHMAREQSRRDDLESLGHMLFYFLREGSLPWQGIKTKDLKQKYQMIGRLKQEVPISELGKGHPREFEEYLRYCRRLKFKQEPDYIYLRRLFRDCLSRLQEKEDRIFDWTLELAQEAAPPEPGSRSESPLGKKTTPALPFCAPLTHLTSFKGKDQQSKTEAGNNEQQEEFFTKVAHQGNHQEDHLSKDGQDQLSQILSPGAITVCSRSGFPDIPEVVISSPTDEGAQNYLGPNQAEGSQDAAGESEGQLNVETLTPNRPLKKKRVSWASNVSTLSSDRVRVYPKGMKIRRKKQRRRELTWQEIWCVPCLCCFKLL